MAESIQDIQRRIRSVESTSHITNAMRLISGAKFRKTKARFDRVKLPLTEITDLLKGMGLAEETEDACKAKKTVYLLMTSNKGLCGGYNTALYKALSAEIDEKMRMDLRAHGRQAEAQTWELLTIGRKGYEHFARLSYPLSSAGVWELENFQFADAQQLAVQLVGRYLSGEVQQVCLVYTAYVNSLQQTPIIERILPAAKDPAAREIAKGAGPMEDGGSMEYLPSAEAVFATLLPTYIALCLYRAAACAAVCEHAARRGAMENAAKSAEDMQKTLSRSYNRARQQAITNELIEIVAGAEAQQ